MERSGEWFRVPPEDVLKALEDAPPELCSDVSIASALASVGRTEEALTKLQDVIVHDPNNSGAFLVLGALLADAGDREQAIEHMRQAVRIAPDDLSTHWGLGFMLHKYGQIEEAKVELAEVVSIGTRLAGDDKPNRVSEQFIAAEAQKMLNAL